MEEAEKQKLTTVRLHTGEPSIYGAVREQMDLLDEKGILYESCPGVSACFGAAALLNLEYTFTGSIPIIDHYPHGRQNQSAGEREH